MDINKIREMAGIAQEEFDELRILDEAVEIPADASHEHVGKMLDAAKKALSISRKLKNEAQRKKHFGRVMAGLNKINRHLKKMGGVDPTEKKD
jgi:hypothetical protein